MKYSYQREQILKIVQSSYGHLSANEVHEQVRKIIPNISLGTVYRNLNTLAEHHFIRRIIMPHGSDEYDYNVEPHSHIYCVKCGNIYDLPSKVDERMQKLVEKEAGYTITKSSVVFEGICPQCESEKEG